MGVVSFNTTEWEIAGFSFVLFPIIFIIAAGCYIFSCLKKQGDYSLALNFKKIIVLFSTPSINYLSIWLVSKYSFPLLYHYLILLGHLGVVYGSWATCVVQFFKIPGQKFYFFKIPMWLIYIFFLIVELCIILSICFMENIGINTTSWGLIAIITINLLYFLIGLVSIFRLKH